MEINYKDLGIEIKKQRALKNMSARKLAEEANVSVATLCYVETNTKKTRLETIYKIANVLGIDAQKYIK